MKAIVLAVLFLPLFVPFTFSQDQETAARAAAGCGPNPQQFAVKTDGNHHPTGKADADKALVYVFADEDRVNDGFHIGGLITRFGLDGSWVGATNWKSYFFFPTDPGEHRLCTSQQSDLKYRSDIAAAVSFTAEAGKVYYYRTKTPEQRHNSKIMVELVAVDPAQAQLLIASSAFSTFHLKK